MFTFLIYYLAFLSNWFYFEAFVTSHLALSKDLFVFTNRLCMIHFWLSDCFNSFNTLVNFKFASKSGWMTPEISDLINNKLRLKNGHVFYSHRIRRGVSESQKELDLMYQAITAAQSNEALGYMGTINRNIEVDKLGVLIKNNISDRIDMNKVNLIQAIKFLINSVSQTFDVSLLYFDRWADPVRTIRYDDLRHEYLTLNRVLENLGIKYILPGMIDEVKLLRESFSGPFMTGYRSTFTALLIIDACAMTVIFMMIIVTALYIQRDMSDMAKAYNFLTGAEIDKELKALKKAEAFLTRELFDDHAMMEEAHLMNHAPIIIESDFAMEQSQKPKAKKQAKHGSHRSIGSKPRASIQIDPTSSLASRIKVTSMKKLQIVRNVRNMSRATGTVMGTPTKIVIVAPLLSLIIKLLIGVSIVLMVLVDRKVNTNDNLKSISLDTTELILRMQQTFTNFQLYSPHNVRLIENREAYYSPEQLTIEYKDNLDKFMKAARTYELAVRDVEGTKNVAFMLLYGDMCSLAYQRPDGIEDTDFTCRQMNYKMATKGFVRFCITEHGTLSQLQVRLGEVLPTLDFSTNPEIVDKSMVNLWFTRQFVELRVGHHIVAENMVNISRVMTNRLLDDNNSQVIGLMNALRVVGLTIVTVPFILFIVMIVVFANRDYMTALYTFEIMSPDTLLSNQYVLAIFKKYLQTTSR